MRRNRSIKSKFELTQKLPLTRDVNLNRPLAESYYFGEPIDLKFGSFVNRVRVDQIREAQVRKDQTFSDESDKLSDIEIFGFDKSSSSSVSWSDEFDTENTQQVQNEFARMERVLQGKEAIPLHYDRLEYEEWIKTFPDLSVLGRNAKGNNQASQSNESRHAHEEILAIHPVKEEDDADDVATSIQLETTASTIKDTVVDKIFDTVYSRLFHKNTNEKIQTSFSSASNQPKPKVFTKTPNSTTKDLRNLERDFHNYLKISPLSLADSSLSQILEARQRSSQSITRSEISASKWMQPDPNEYSSLPYLLSPTCAKYNSSKVVKQKHVGGKKSSSSSKSHLTLPPIPNFSANHYRSISATPHKQQNQKLCGDFQDDSSPLRSRRSTLEVKSCVLQNHLDNNRGNSLKPLKKL